MKVVECEQTLPCDWQDYLLQQIDAGVSVEKAISDTAHHYHKGELLNRRPVGGKTMSESLLKISYTYYGGRR